MLSDGWRKEMIVEELIYHEGKTSERRRLDEANFSILDIEPDPLIEAWGIVFGEKIDAQRKKLKEEGVKID